jgi:hypothetical protein
MDQQNVLRMRINMDAFDYRLRGIGVIMVPSDVNNFTIQFAFILLRFRLRALAGFSTRRIFETKISDVEQKIVGFNSTIVIADNSFVHIFQCFKWAVTVARNIPVAKVIIGTVKRFHFRSPSTQISINLYNCFGEIHRSSPGWRRLLIFKKVLYKCNRFLASFTFTVYFYPLVSRHFFSLQTI